MNKGRWASIRPVARRSVCSAVDVSVILVVLALQCNNSSQFTPASTAGLLVERTVRKNCTACLEPRGPQPYGSRNAAGTPGRGTSGQVKVQVAAGSSTS